MEANSENMFAKVFIGVAIAVISAIVIKQCDIEGQGKTGEEKPIISGIYKGYCNNQTYGKKGRLVLTINQEDTGEIKGTMNITGGLFGSGEIEGYFDGSSIGFTSKEATTGVVISWEGIVENDVIAGEYTASLPPNFQYQTGLIDQVGDWEVSK